MEDVLGAHTDPDRFDAFLRDWETVMARRVEETVATFAHIPGIRGLILAGSVGRGEAWPLSDIDLLPIYDDDLAEQARAEVECRRLESLDRWVREGWWTGIDVGNLFFHHAEVQQALGAGDAGVLARMVDNRWYHSTDKGYRGRAVYDPTGCADELVRWLTERRFRPEVVQLRLMRDRSEVERARARLQSCKEKGDLLGAVKAVLAVVHWLRTWLLESWGERDNSLGRLGTRFERVAKARNRPDLVDQINSLSDLDDAASMKRMELVPWWVRERHERSWRARQHVGEDVTRAQDVRDTLRVCTTYGFQEITVAPFPPWLAVPADLGALEVKVAQLTVVVHACLGEEAERPNAGTTGST